MIVSRVAKRYAKALFDIGIEDKNYKQYGQELKEFTDLCMKHPEFFDFLTNPLFKLEEKTKVLDEILGKAKFSEVLNNFLKVLLEKNRINKVLEISNYYSKLVDEHLGIARAKIIIAQPIKKKILDRLVNVLEKFTSKKIEPEIEVDESIIGGVIVKIGDLVLDGSITAQLEGLKESLKRGEVR